MWVGRRRVRLKLYFHINKQHAKSYILLFPVLNFLKSAWYCHAENSIWICQRPHLCLFSNSYKIRKKTCSNSSLLCRTGFLHFLQMVWMTGCLAQLEPSEYFADGYYVLICTSAEFRKQDRSFTELKGDINQLEI